MDDAVLVGLCLFPHAVQVVLLLRTVDGDAYRQMVAVLGYEALYLRRMVVDAVGRKREAVAVEPVMVQLEHPQFQIVANLVDKLNLQKRLTANKVPYHALLAKLILATQHIVDKRLCRFPRHPLLDILAYKVTILASQLAVLGDDERDVLHDFFLPSIKVRF